MKATIVLDGEADKELKKNIICDDRKFIRQRFFSYNNNLQNIGIFFLRNLGIKLIRIYFVFSTSKP